METWGRYSIEKRLASGGMAEVYLARQLGIEGVGRPVVIKRILPEQADNDEFVTMFLDEARLMAALNHPNIAAVYDLGKLEDSYFLAMEYVHGPTLLKLTQAANEAGHQGLPIRVALPIVLRIAEALAYLHELHDEYGRPLEIVHRDINPANVMIGHNGSVKLIDFGIAKAASKVYQTRVGVVKGTFGYIAPEQIVDTAGVDHRADLFSLGALMYETCVGTTAFGAPDAADHVERILAGQYARPTMVNPSFPFNLEALIDECLAVNPDQRPANIFQFIERLATCMTEHKIIPVTTHIAEATNKLVPDPRMRPILSRTEGSVAVRLPTHTAASIRPVVQNDGAQGTAPAISPLVADGTDITVGGAELTDVTQISQSGQGRALGSEPDRTQAHERPAWDDETIASDRVENPGEYLDEHTEVSGQPMKAIDPRASSPNASEVPWTKTQRTQAPAQPSEAPPPTVPPLLIAAIVAFIVLLGIGAGIALTGGG